MENKYTSKEIAEILNVSDKSVRRYLNSYFSINNGAYEISVKMLNILKTEHLGQSADTDVQEFERVEYFTEEEYQEFHKRLVEYSNLKEQLEYHKKSSENHSRQMDIILNIMQQRNFIEATEKRLEEK